jgi:hypothetical protein
MPSDRGKLLFLVVIHVSPKLKITWKIPAANCHHYSNIKTSMYVKLNTGLPASAAVERLFSLSGRVFTPLRANMTIVHFEMLSFCARSNVAYRPNHFDFYASWRGADVTQTVLVFSVVCL